MPLPVVGLNLPAAARLLIRANDWNLLAIGDDWAAACGLNTLLTLHLTLRLGFAGLIVPQALRMTIGPDHRLLLPASFRLGGPFLLYIFISRATIKD